MGIFSLIQQKCAEGKERRIPYTVLQFSTLLPAKNEKHVVRASSEAFGGRNDSTI